MIQIDNLSKNYGDVRAVDSISFSLNESEIVGFLGANGAGKSTTLKMITGYLSPSNGNVHVGDKNILDNCIDIQKMIGYLPELNPLYAEMKVHEYLKFHASIREITGNKFNEALKRVVKVLMSSHILQEIQATVDRIIIIDKGKIVADGTSEELISSAQGVKQLHLEIRNAEEDSIQNMKATIPQINIKTIKKDEKSFNINLEYKSGTDPREDIFNHAVSQSWVITEMRVSEKNLEDIFRNLTNKSDEGTPNE